MADFTALKNSIRNYIKQNGNAEITGEVLQNILISMVVSMGDGAINGIADGLANEGNARTNADGLLQNAIDSISAALGDGYTYAGIATAGTTPISGRVFYLALQAGTYTNFGGLVVTQGINVLKNNDGTWQLDNVIGIDDVPTAGSPKLVKSGGVFANIGAFDISDYNKTGTTLATYADLTAALAALPSEYQKGGMSVKYVQSSDNKYIQARCTANEFTTDITKWQSVDDEPTAGSDNLVESGGVYKKIEPLVRFPIDVNFEEQVVGYYVNNYGRLEQNSDFAYIDIELSRGDKITVFAKGYSTVVSIVSIKVGDKRYSKVVSTDNVYKKYEYTAPNDCVITLSYNKNTTPWAIINPSILSENEINGLNTKYQLKTEVDYVGEIIGKFINNTGYVEDNEDYSYVTIDVHKNDVVKFNASGYQSSVAMISRVNGSLFIPLVISQSGVTHYEYTATDNEKLALCYKHGDAHYADIYSTLWGAIETALIQTESVNFDDAISGYFIDSGGYKDENSDTSIIDIQLKSGDTIKFVAKGYSNVISMIAEKVGGKYSKLVGCVDSKVREYSYTADRDIIITLSYYHTTTYSAIIEHDYKKRIDDSDDNIVINSFGYGVLFDRMAVIGDSLSSGSLWNGDTFMGDIYGNSWLSYLAKQCNASARNHYSEGGLTCKTWLQNYLTKLLSDTASNVYFIALGTNDRYSQPYPLGTIDDAAGTDSFVGYYKEIVANIKQKAPNAAIFCLSLYKKNNDYNPMIRQIAELTDTFFLDYANTAKIALDGDKVYSQGSHFTTVGYLYAASVISQCINNYISRNPEKFQYYGYYNPIGEKYNP